MKDVWKIVSSLGISETSGVEDEFVERKLINTFINYGRDKENPILSTHSLYYNTHGKLNEELYRTMYCLQ